MGGCASGGNKDVDVDIYMQKHHKRTEIKTNKEDYEISKQNFEGTFSTIQAKKVPDELQFNDDYTER